MIMLMILTAIAGYLLGSVNTSLVVGKLLYKKDIRQYGSGNAGLTNTLRTLGKTAALLVVFGDVIKGVLACLIGFYLAGETSEGVHGGVYVAGLFAVVGHNWPVYFGFKGGKGALTSLAVAMYFSPLAALACLGVFIAILAVTRYVSLGSIVSAILFPAAALLFGSPLFAVITGSALAVMIVLRHVSNIKRLLAGNESKISFKSGSVGEKA
jgi:glycerol-3-phosphate acyltransferase PlsY